MNKIEEQFTPLLRGMLDKKSQTISNALFVFAGVEHYVDMNSFSNEVVDVDTFGKYGDQATFDQSWMQKVFMRLMDNSKKYQILSYAQFCSLLIYLQPELLKSRVLIVRDGLRSLFPLDKSYYIQATDKDNNEARPDDMPIYMADQIHIGSQYYYSTNLYETEFSSMDLINKRKPMDCSPVYEGHDVIDTVSDLHGLDVFLNNCLLEGNFSKKVFVKVYKKQPLKDKSTSQLEKLNWLLSLFGGEIYEIEDSNEVTDLTPKPETFALLRKYWGENADFRKLKVYSDPSSNKKEIVSISQGTIVEKIIQEYQNGKTLGVSRDLYMTASTGAGKSLMFQLPAFHISANNDVTIVVSPLISLMKDQVSQMYSERKFEKVHYLNSELSLIDRERVVNECKNGKIDVLYLSPELLLSYNINYFVGERHIGLMVIDEAHLITTWGRDFRVDYWFLGQHIDKIRRQYKESNKSFPVVAFTATGVFGGDNDMVFDSINSLYMHDPYVYIGEIKRDDITFVIDTHDSFGQSYDTKKEAETESFIQKAVKADVKTIVYAPLKKQIDVILSDLQPTDCSDKVVSYYAKLAPETKEFALNKFKNNDAKVIVCTKAFGMGVDIPDVQMVYHHAPSGLLPDYIQEIGRAARTPGLKGFAALSYSEDDQRYSRRLHGMSAIRQYQLKEVLTKIYKTYLAKGQHRNMLVSSDDFAYIFGDNIDYDGKKLMTSLMMIEKDYLAKYRYNVLIARPKKLFVKVYCAVPEVSFQILSEKYRGMFKEVPSNFRNRHIVVLDLDEIWRNNFSERSFPSIKYDYYNGILFREDKIELDPMVKLTFTLETDVNTAIKNLNDVLDNLCTCFNNFQDHFFTKNDLEDAFSAYITDNNKRDRIVEFFLDTYTSQSGNIVELTAFLQRRKSRRGNHDEYQVQNRQYNHNIQKLRKKMNHLFEGKKDKISERFVSAKGDDLLNYIRLGSLLEILNIGTYESKGGDNPMVFIRLNDPKKIHKDSMDKKLFKFNSKLI